MASSDDASQEKKEDYEYDLVVIGGGSGGISCAKTAGKLGARVALFDYVVPTNHGTEWGLGGTCVNVGCIPKKLMHYSSLLKASFHDAHELGWEFEHTKFNWDKMINTINSYIRSLNWGYKVELKDKNVKYYNALAKFIDDHTIEYVDKKGKTGKVTSKYFVIAVGGRPNVPKIPGIELAITSDDIFWRQTPPGKTLVVGGSYIALETAGFLHKMGYDTTVMVRSILLRGFDRECANLIGDHMEEIGIKMQKEFIPLKLEKTDDGKIKVTSKSTKDPSEHKKDGDGDDVEMYDEIIEQTEIYDTVLFATGRSPETHRLNLQSAGVEIAENGKLNVNNEQTNILNIYAIGDIVNSAPELTPVAIQAGNLLAKRLFANSKILMDYVFVPTTVFTPIEYGCCGYSEEEAKDVYGEKDLEIYHQRAIPLEYASTHRLTHDGQEIKINGFAKIICVKSEHERVVGFHYVGPNAGEVTQGFGLALKMKATKADFDNVVGIHPTTAEWFTVLNVSKASGESAEATGC